MAGTILLIRVRGFFLSLLVIGCSAQKINQEDEPLLAQDLADEPAGLLEGDFPIASSQPDGEEDLSVPSVEPLTAIQPERPISQPHELRSHIAEPAQSNVWHRLFEKRLAYHNQRWIKPESAVVRALPSENSKIVGELRRGDLVLVESVSDNWARLRSGAYIRLKELSNHPLILDEPVNSDTQDEPFP